MTRLWLVRHARPTSSWGDGSDPGLDAVGHEQAAAMAVSLGAADRRTIVTSPLQRTLETAAALADVWDTEAVLEPRVGEIPTPEDARENRPAWLRATVTSRWSALDDALRDWRENVLASVGAIERDSVVVSHFVAINAIVGAATADDRVVVFSPDHASITEVEVDRSGMSLIRLGAESSTTVR